MNAAKETRDCVERRSPAIGLEKKGISRSVAGFIQEQFWDDLKTLHKRAKCHYAMLSSEPASDVGK